jgi:hypothetical protein
MDSMCGARRRRSTAAALLLAALAAPAAADLLDRHDPFAPRDPLDFRRFQPEPRLAMPELRGLEPIDPRQGSLRELDEVFPDARDLLTNRDPQRRLRRNAVPPRLPLGEPMGRDPQLLQRFGHHRYPLD